ncbi:hypothetical protein WMF37_50710 [Sorangium sp. So ce291]|uniref:hypothetical protein n=1 Tax=Sorangium sp. So ce291 TaxID=3133294 RepID=UPI003F62DF84
MARRLFPARFAARALLCPALLAAGCAQPAEDPGSTGYVLLDRAARGRWTVASDGWEGAPVLPVALDVQETALLRGPDGAELLELRGGTLAHVRGAEGEIRWLAVGEEARGDRLVLRASNAAAAELAALVGGEVAARGDDLWTLTAPDLLDRGSFLDAPGGVLEVLPDTQRDPGALDALAPLDERLSALAPLDARISLGTPAAGPASAGDAAPGAPDPGRAEAEVVGLYAAELQTLLLDASGGFTLEDRCTGEVLATGKYLAVADRVVLRSAVGEPIVLGRDREKLFHPGWADFAPLAPEPARRGASGHETTEEAGQRAGEERP